MYVLGIETSCDETAASVVKDGHFILSNVVSSSLTFHKKYGGIIPEIAFRKQLETLSGIVDCAIEEARIKLKDIRLISVTSGPGLLGALLVGISFAKAASFQLGIHLLGVNHLHGHIYSNFLNKPKIKLPFVALIISGGHTALFYVSDFNEITAMGSTEDDACGEAFDKVAKILKLGYPGGPLIERLAAKGNPKKIKFSCSNPRRPLGFSFSGIKTAVLYYVNKHSAISYQPLDKKKNYEPSTVSHQLTCDIAASFQEAVIEALIEKSFFACHQKKTNRLVIGGGVAANKRLRERFLQKAGQHNIEVRFPEIKLCTDNAAMVAGLGYRLFKKKEKSDLYLSADLN